MPQTSASTAASAMMDHARRVQWPTMKASLAFSIDYSFGSAVVVRRGCSLWSGARSSRNPIRRGLRRQLADRQDPLYGTLGIGRWMAASAAKRGTRVPGFLSVNNESHPFNSFAGLRDSIG